MIVVSDACTTVLVEATLPEYVVMVEVDTVVGIGSPFGSGVYLITLTEGPVYGPVVYCIVGPLHADVVVPNSTLDAVGDGSNTETVPVFPAAVAADIVLRDCVAPG